MPAAKSLKDLMRIRAHNKNLLDSINDNPGTALGYKKVTGGPISDEPAVIVFVPRKGYPKWIPNSQLIPKKLEGPDGLTCPLDVVEGSQAEKEIAVDEDVAELTERLRGWDDQIWAGSQIPHWVNQTTGSYSMGTLGAFAKKKTDGTFGFLTNQHVGIAPGQSIFHPVPWGTQIGTTERVMEHVRDEDQYHSPIGLLWGGWQSKLRTGHAQENWTYGITLSRVLDALDIDLVADHE